MQSSPFPGMDPFIEAHEWPPFHLRFIASLDRYLSVRLPEGYALAPETGITARDLITGEDTSFRPDIGIQEVPVREAPAGMTDTATLTPPSAVGLLAEPRQRTLTIRTVDRAELILAIEVLTPANKGGYGLAEYIERRRELLRHRVHIIEIDLLRGGTPPYTDPSWPEKTYHIQVLEGGSEAVSYWAVGMDEVLPTIGVPLLPRDGVLALNLQEVFTETYRYGLYRRTLRYDVKRLRPPATEGEREVMGRYLG